MQILAERLGSTVDAAPGERLADVDPDRVVGLLRDHGWVYFTGFAPSIDEFAEFTRRFGRCATPRVIHYPPGGVALGFHAEDSYNPWRPDALWFLCLSAGSDGGAPTGVVDGVALLQELDPAWREFSFANELAFTRQWRAADWQSAAGGDERDAVSEYLATLPGLEHKFLDDGTLWTQYVTPLVVTTRLGDPSLSNTLLHAVTDQEYYGMTLASGEPVPQEYIDHVERIALDSEVPIGWRDGDLVVIDNYRLMHRRGEYSGKDRDLRVIHGEEFYGSVMPPADTPLAMKLKEALQGEEDLR